MEEFLQVAYIVTHEAYAIYNFIILVLSAPFCLRRKNTDEHTRSLNVRGVCLLL
jgi:hypothetical protein